MPDHQIAANDNISVEEWLRIVRREARARQRRLVRGVGLRRPLPSADAVIDPTPFIYGGSR